MDHVHFAYAALIILWVCGCTQVLGLDDYRVGPRSNADGSTANSKAPIKFYDAACGSCAATQCGAELRECEAAPACKDATACFYGCGGGSEPYYYGDPARTGGGYAWFINVPPDSTTVVVSLDGNPLQTTRVPVRAGATTVVHFNYPQFR